MIELHRDDLNRVLERHKTAGFVIMRNLARILARKLVHTNMRLRNALI